MDRVLGAQLLPSRFSGSFDELAFLKVAPARASATSAEAAQKNAEAAGRNVQIAVRALEVTRLTASQAEERSKREELLRNVRWAAELAVSADPARARLGVAQLRVLSDSPLLDPAHQPIIDAALLAVVGPKLEEVAAAGIDAQVWRIAPPEVPSTEMLEGEAPP